MSPRMASEILPLKKRIVSSPLLGQVVERPAVGGFLPDEAGLGQLAQRLLQFEVGGVALVQDEVRDLAFVRGKSTLSSMYSTISL